MTLVSLVEGSAADGELQEAASCGAKRKPAPSMSLPSTNCYFARIASIVRTLIPSAFSSAGC